MLRAAEQDTSSLIDGVVASEPVTQMPTAAGYGINVGGVAAAGHGKSLADFVTAGNLYQPCAALAPAAAMTELSTFNFMVIAGMTVDTIIRTQERTVLSYLAAPLRNRLAKSMRER